MPNLPGSTVEGDVEMFDKVLGDPDLQADQWKVSTYVVCRFTYHSGVRWYLLFVCGGLRGACHGSKCTLVHFVFSTRFYVALGMKEKKRDEEAVSWQDQWSRKSAVPLEPDNRIETTTLTHSSPVS